MAIGFRVDIRLAGTPVGSGPLTSVSRWKVTKRLDQAGDWSFVMAATDPQRSQVQLKREAAIYALLDSTWTYVGGGNIDSIEKTVNADGTVTLTVSGGDQLRTISDDRILVIGQWTSDFATVLEYFRPVAAGWTYTHAQSPTVDLLYATYQYETVLSALVLACQRADMHFYLSGDRALTFRRTFTSSGVRAIKGSGDLAADQAAITRLTIAEQSYDVVTKVRAFGAGNGGASLSMAAATNSLAPLASGYSLDIAASSIFSIAGSATYGTIERAVQFPDIRPMEGTDAALGFAADALKWSALYWLMDHDHAVTSYRLSVAQCSVLLRPLQTIRLSYRDADAGIALEEDLYILETTWSGDASGVRTTDLVVADSERWPETDSSVVAESIGRGNVYQVHPQLNANSYVIPYTVPVDDTETAELRFRFDAEVVQVKRVTLDVKLTALESTVKSVAGSSTSTGASTASSSGNESSHTHEIPDHVHYITITGNAAPTYPIGYGAGGTAGGWQHNASANNHEYPTDSGTGGVTSQAGDQHSHNIEHTHDVTAGLSSVYGIYRAPGAELFDLEDDLEYSLNGTTWYAWGGGVNGYDASLGSGWVRVTLTSLLINTTTFRPLAANNSIRVRRKTAGAATKKAMINAQLNILTIIQADALT